MCYPQPNRKELVLFCDFGFPRMSTNLRLFAVTSTNLPPLCSPALLNFLPLLAMAHDTWQVRLQPVLAQMHVGLELMKTNIAEVPTALFEPSSAVRDPNLALPKWTSPLHSTWHHAFMRIRPIADFLQLRILACAPRPVDTALPWKCSNTSSFVVNLGLEECLKYRNGTSRAIEPSSHHCKLGEYDAELETQNCRHTGQDEHQQSVTPLAGN
jgi:hypothetical protein